MENHKIHVPNHQPDFHMGIEIVDIPIIAMVDLSIVMLDHQRVNI
jgi:hypothetical protein